MPLKRIREIKNPNRKEMKVLDIGFSVSEENQTLIRQLEDIKVDSPSVKYRITIEQNQKREIEQAIALKLGEIQDRERFGILQGEHIVVGIRDGNLFVIEKIITKII
jgi:hypothetical protein